MTKEEKISLLKGLLNGSISTDRISPKKLRLEIRSNGETSCFIDSKPVSTDEFVQQYYRQGPLQWDDPNMNIIVKGTNMKDPAYRSRQLERIYQKNPELLAQPRRLEN